MQKSFNDLVPGDELVDMHYCGNFSRLNLADAIIEPVKVTNAVELHTSSQASGSMVIDAIMKAECDKRYTNKILTVLERSGLDGQKVVVGYSYDGMRAGFAIIELA